MLTPTTLDLIAEYLILAPNLKKTSSAADYRRANLLALRLALELPPDEWRAMVRAVSGGTFASVWGAVLAVRQMTGVDTPEPNEEMSQVAFPMVAGMNLGNVLTQDDAVLFGPGIGKPKPSEEKH